MARLSDLIPGFATALKVPERSVRNVAAVLRLNKLLTTGPRGPGAPHMGPSDATNLLLALMYDDDHQEAGSTVPRLRNAVLDKCEGRIGFDYGGGKIETPRHDFLYANGEPHKLGEALDLILHEIACCGSLGDDEDDAKPLEWLDVVNFSFEVSRPGYSARLWLDTISVHWTLDYSWHDPEDAERRAGEKARGELPMHRLAHLGSYMTSMRAIRDAELTAIGDVLRGFDLLASDREACDPPYMPRLCVEGAA